MSKKTVDLGPGIPRMDVEPLSTPPVTLTCRLCQGRGVIEGGTGSAPRLCPCHKWQSVARAVDSEGS